MKKATLILLFIFAAAIGYGQTKTDTAKKAKPDTNFTIGLEDAIRLYSLLVTAQEALQSTISPKITVAAAVQNTQVAEEFKQRIIKKYIPKTGKK